jgi:GPI-anchor transamidase subunit U
MDKQKALIFGTAVAIRLLLFKAFPSLPTILTNRVEISTPVSSYKRRKLDTRLNHGQNTWANLLSIVLEGVFLYTHNIPPYDGGVFHQAPLLLPLFSVLEPFQNDLATAVLYIALDLLSANALMAIADTGEASSSRLYTSQRKELRYSSVSVAAA